MVSLLDLLKALCWIATFVVMLGGTLRVGGSAFQQMRQRPALFVRTLLAVWIAVPVLTFVVILVFNIQGLAATIMLLMAFCPGVPLLLASTRTVHGAMSTAFVVLLLTAATEPLLIPLGLKLVNAIHPVGLVALPVDIIKVLVPTVYLPVALGLVIRALWIRAAEPIARGCDIVHVIGVTGSIAFTAFHAMPMLPQVPVPAMIAVVVLTLGDAAIGYWAGRPSREDQKAIAMASAMGNPALALVVVEASFPTEQAHALVSTYLVLRGVALILIERWLKHVSNRGAPTPEPFAGSS